jgi:hypothetical protein
MAGYKPTKIHLKDQNGGMICRQNIQTSVYDSINPPLKVTDKKELITCEKCKKYIERHKDK